MGENLYFSQFRGCCWVFANVLQAKLSPQGLGGTRYDHGQLCADHLRDSSLFNLSTIPAWGKGLSKNVCIYRRGQEHFLEATSAGKSLCQAALRAKPSGLGVTSTSPRCGPWHLLSTVTPAWPHPAPPAPALPLLPLPQQIPPSPRHSPWVLLPRKPQRECFTP